MFRHPLPSALAIGCLLSSLLLSHDLRAADPASTRPALTADDQTLQRDFAEETSDLGGERSFQNGVLTIKLPRTDLWVQGEMGEIPTGAGLASCFYFFRCECGKDRLVGQFVLADYEVNDVIDALRSGQVEVVSIGPMFMGDKPRMMEVHIQAEGKADAITKTLKSALDWVGDARSAKQPIAGRPPADSNSH